MKRVLLFFAILLGGSSPLFSFQMELRNGSYLNEPQKVRAPELKGDIGWLNTDKPLSIAGLKGKIILLDFWTYGCINCIHIIPDLKMLEAKYEKELVVIGVHSAKFDNERETENIRRIILRYGVEHPVVNDAKFKIWDAYAVRAYPTQVLIDPEGYIVGRFVGEGNLVEIDQAIAETRLEFIERGKLDQTPLKFALEKAKVGSLPLSFPGKVLADENSGRLFIADSNHNRIVVTDFDGQLLEVIGSGDASAADGSFSEAGFNKPQGMAIEGDVLYVADTENQRIRRVKLKEKRVETIAGTGVLSDFTGFGGRGLETALRSPWDLDKVGEYLYIAMAGSHQIWRMDLVRDYIEPYAGTRWEARTDGPIKTSAWAQPSGLVSDGKKLFVADSESNIIREVDFTEEVVTTLVGGDLYVFGDRDGRGDNVRLQHPLGIELYDGKLLIADTYNHKIKMLDPAKRRVESLYGSGSEGQKDGLRPSFYEPGGISVAGNQLFVADTNNHAVRIVNLESGRTRTLKIDGLTPPKEITAESVSPNLKIIDGKARRVLNSEVVNLKIDVGLPKGFHLNPNAPQRYDVSFDEAVLQIGEPKRKFKELPIRIPVKAVGQGSTKISAKVNIYYCREDNTGVCYIKTLVWNIPVKIVKKGSFSDVIELNTSVGN